MSSQQLGGTHSVPYGTSQIEYELIYTERDDLAVNVHPDGSVTIEAPLHSDLGLIESKVKKRAKWIVKQQQVFRDYATAEPNRLYVSGETHFYLGKRYRLKLIQDDFERVQFYRGRIFLSVNNLNDWQHKHDLMQQWYRVRSRFIFEERLHICYTRFEDLAIPFPQIEIRAMKSRWGSCTPSGKMMLNLTLIKVPKKLIDYVIVHELCHLKEHNHSSSFYALLDRVLPNWQSLRQELNQWDFK